MAEDYPRDALEPGYQLLWYKIDKVLGEGGFGMTYLAHDVNLDKLVAIKEYLPSDMCRRQDDKTISPNTKSLEDFETGLTRFIREARTIAKFDHPHVVKVTNVFEENNTAYMAMAYEKGKDLKSYINPRKTLDEDHLLSLMLPILEGLEYVHNTGFIHRDIKPGNIMIREDGSPVLIDFGSVHDTKRAKEAVTTLVSPGYTPHEQYVGKSDAQGPWTDIYSLGATLYRCVCGTHPVDAITRGSALIKQQPDPLHPASEIAKGKYTESFLLAIDHALAFNEKERPKNISDWRSELIGNKTVTFSTSRYTGTVNSTYTTHTKTGDTVQLNSSADGKKSGGTAKYTIAAVIIASITAAFLFTSNKGGNSPDINISSTSKVTPIETPTETTIETAKTEDNRPITATATVLKEALSEFSDSLKDGTSGPSLVVLPKGTIEIGSDESEKGHRPDEWPKTAVTIEQTYAIGKTEVTVRDFRKFVSATAYLTEAELDTSRGCRTFEDGWGWSAGRSWKDPGYKQTEKHPVVCISWNDALAYVNWLSAQTGFDYQLPSETLWEYAARAGKQDTRFWGDKKACDYANVSDFTRAQMHSLTISEENIFPCEDGFTYSAEAASFAPNDYGLHDTLGNVWEWTADCWVDSYSNIDTSGATRNTNNCNNRIYRGGSWGNLPVLVRAAKRLTDPSNYRYYNLGFRISRIIEG